MSRIVTAVYRSYSIADLVRRELEQIGVARKDIVVVPDADEPAETGRPRDNRELMDALADLDLPDRDTRDYQQCVRRGDYVVSAHLEDDLVDRASKIMRNPEAEARDLDALSREFQDTKVIRHSGRPDGARLSTERDASAAHPYVRSYRRGDFPV